MKRSTYIMSIIVLALYLFPFEKLNAQIFSGSSDISVSQFNFRVKQLNEFADRFNFKTDHTGTAISETESPEINRKTIILTLFDQEDSRFSVEESEVSADYQKLVMSFIDDVLSNNFLIDKYSENIYSRAICSGTYKDEKVDFSIILQQERVGKDMLKWVVKDLESEFLEFLEEDSIMLRFLPPSSDELDFMELRRALNDSTHLDGYSYRDFKYDPLSVFYYLINKGEVKLESILEIEYIIRDIPGYEFTLKDFNRPSNNSGWLIRDLKRVD